MEMRSFGTSHFPMKKFEYSRGGFGVARWTDEPNGLEDLDCLWIVKGRAELHGAMKSGRVKRWFAIGHMARVETPEFCGLPAGSGRVLVDARANTKDIGAEARQR